MEDVIDLIASDLSPSEVSDTIKSMLYSKAASKIDSLRPNVASSIFGEDEEQSLQDEE